MDKPIPIFFFTKDKQMYEIKTQLTKKKTIQYIQMLPETNFTKTSCDVHYEVSGVDGTYGLDIECSNGKKSSQQRNNIVKNLDMVFANEIANGLIEKHEVGYRTRYIFKEYNYIKGANYKAIFNYIEQLYNTQISTCITLGL